jgi:serine/threonine-protein kinase
MKPGTLLQGKYRLISLIAEGGMGDVWSAEHQGLDVPVAVKVMHEGEASSATTRARFEAEAKTAASLRSPHLVQLFDFGIDEGTQTPFIVMELVGGESLRDRIERERALPMADVARIVTHVSRALGRAHEMNVAHRALEPSNIFLGRNGDEEMAKVLGIAKLSVQSSAQGSTRVGTLTGATKYMSPERIRGSEVIDARTDLWSLAVIAVECLTGQLPFDADNLPGLARRICHGEPKLPSQLGPVPAGFDAWFRRATALEPEGRFASATEMAAELRALCGVSSSSVPAAVDAVAPFTPGLASPVSYAPPPGGELPNGPWLGASAVPASFPVARTGRRWAFGAAGVLLLGGAAYALLAPPKVVPVAQTIAAQPVVVQEVHQIRAKTGISVFGEGPGLTLLVDGKEIGPLPRELPDMEPGEHVIQVTGGPRYEIFQRSIVVEPDRIVPIGPIRLKVTHGLATITAGAGAEEAEVTLQVGDSRSVLPALPLQLEVETEKPHVLTARRKGYEVFEEEITFEDGQARKAIEISLIEAATEEPERRRRPTRGASSSGPTPSSERARASEKTEAAAREPVRRATLTLASTPPSNVILDGKPLGSTPRRNITVEPGTHRVIFIHEASRKMETVEVAPGSSQTVSVNF